MIEQFLEYIPEDKQQAFLDCFTYQTVNTLNELLQLDAKAVECLIDIRLPCQEDLGAKCFISGVDNYQVGVLGIINSILPSTKKVMPVYLKQHPTLPGPYLSLFISKDLQDGEKHQETKAD